MNKDLKMKLVLTLAGVDSPHLWRTRLDSDEADEKRIESAVVTDSTVGCYESVWTEQ